MSTELLIIIWASTGFISGLVASKYDEPTYPYVTVADFIASLTIGSILGPVTMIIAIWYFFKYSDRFKKFLDKKLF